MNTTQDPDPLAQVAHLIELSGLACTRTLKEVAVKLDGRTIWVRPCTLALTPALEVSEGPRESIRKTP
jgi:hypothetical protein